MCLDQLKIKRAATALWKAQLNVFDKQDVILIRRVLKVCLEQTEKGSESYLLIIKAYKHFPRPFATTGTDMEVIFQCMSNAPKLLEEVDPSIAAGEAIGRICSLISAWFGIN
jgi:hypothetical protein